MCLSFFKRPPVDQILTPLQTSNPPTQPHLLPSLKIGLGDFSTWKVGPRYSLIRILGHGSYGEVAQAKDLSNGGSFVAIKRINGIFDQVRGRGV